MLRTLLEKDGYEVEDAVDGHNAIEILTEDPSYHLVILDLAMPGLDGRQVLNHIRGSVETSAVPVLIRTGTGSDRIEAELLEAGADDYVEKSVDAERFLARVHAVLRRALL
jgi:DNA-binding response OmpR family regulator